jgi:hypothetical protein
MACLLTTGYTLGCRDNIGGIQAVYIGEYNGEWKNGQKDGQGTLINLDGTIVKGYWGIGQYLGTEKPNFRLASYSCSDGELEIIKECELVINCKPKEDLKPNQDSEEMRAEGDEFSWDGSYYAHECFYFGLKDFNGKILLETEFRMIKRIKNSCSFIMNKDGQFYFFNAGSKPIKFNYFLTLDNESPDYYGALEFSDGLCMVKDLNGKVGFIDELGKEVIKCSYISSKGFSEDLCPVYNGEQWGIINKKGEVIVPFSYSNINNFSEGLALVVKDSKCGYVDKLGKIAIPISFVYKDMSEFCDYDFTHGLAINYSEKGYRFIDKSGFFVGDIYTTIDSKCTLRSTFKLFSVEKTFPAETPLDKVSSGYTKKIGIVNSQGIAVAPIIYTYFYIEDNFIITEKFDKWGLIDSSGKLILEAKFSEEYVRSELKKIQPEKQLFKSYSEVNGVRKVGLVNNLEKVILRPIYDEITKVSDGCYKCKNDGQCFLVTF